MKKNRCRCSLQHNSGDWQKERATRLHRLCNWIETKVSQGKKVRPLTRLAARRWNGKPFRCDPSRKLTLSAGRLATLFYQWLGAGKTPESVALHYNPSNRRIVSRREIARFVRHAAAPGTFTFAAAFAAMQRTRPVSYSATHFFRAIPADQSKALRGLFHGRRRQRGIEVRFKCFVRKAGRA